MSPFNSFWTLRPVNSFLLLLSLCLWHCESIGHDAESGNGDVGFRWASAPFVLFLFACVGTIRKFGWGICTSSFRWLSVVVVVWLPPDLVQRDFDLRILCHCLVLIICFCIYKGPSLWAESATLRGKKTELLAALNSWCISKHALFWTTALTSLFISLRSCCFLCSLFVSCIVFISGSSLFISPNPLFIVSVFHIDFPEFFFFHIPELLSRFWISLRISLNFVSSFISLLFR
jgi:hypothetical protein